MADFKEGETVVVHRNHGLLDKYHWGSSINEVPLLSEGEVRAVNGHNAIVVNIKGVRRTFHPSEVVAKSGLEALLEEKDKLCSQIPAQFLMQLARDHSVVVLEDRVYYLDGSNAQAQNGATLFFHGTPYRLIEMESATKLEFLYRRMFLDQIRQLQATILKDPKRYTALSLNMPQIFDEVKMLHNILTDALPSLVTSRVPPQQSLQTSKELFDAVPNLTPQPKSLLSQVIPTSSAFFSENLVYLIEEADGNEGGNLYVLAGGKVFVPKSVVAKSSVFRRYQHTVLSELEFEALNSVVNDVGNSLKKARQSLVDTIHDLVAQDGDLKFADNGPKCSLTLAIPYEYALWNFKFGDYYLFEPISVVVEVLIEGDGIKFSSPRTAKPYGHPFVHGTDICLADYKPPMDLPVGKRIAAYLLTARQVLLSGYMEGVGPYTRLEKGDFRRVPKSVLEEQRIPITNVHFASGR